MKISVSYLSSVLESEKENKNSLFDLPPNFFEISNILFNNAEDDFDDIKKTRCFPHLTQYNYKDYSQSNNINNNMGYSLNNQYIETSLSAKKNLKIGASSTYKIIAYEGTATGEELTFTIEDITKSFFKDELKLIVSGSTKLSDLIDTKLPFLIEGEEGVYRLSGDITPKISIESEEEVDLDAKYGDVVITSGDTIKQEAPEIRLNAINSDKTGVNRGEYAR